MTCWKHCFKQFYRMRFNFCGVYILQICNFRSFRALNMRLLGTVVLKYSRIYGVSRYTIIVYSSCRGAKLAGLLLDSFEDVIVSNGELHLRIDWRKAWLRPWKKQQRRSVHCCNEERHWNSRHVPRTISCACNMFAGSKNNGSGTKQLAKQGCPVTTYRHFSYAWCHRLVRAVYVSISVVVMVVGNCNWL